MVLLDTSTLIYWTLAPNQLSTLAAHAIAEADVLLVNTLSLWELGIKVQRRKLILPLPVRQYVQLLKSVRGVRMVANDEELWLRTLELTWPQRDPVDRALVATAQLYDCPLVTPDEAIQRFYAKSIW